MTSSLMIEIVLIWINSKIGLSHPFLFIFLEFLSQFTVLLMLKYYTFTSSIKPFICAICCCLGTYVDAYGISIHIFAFLYCFFLLNTCFGSQRHGVYMLLHFSDIQTAVNAERIWLPQQLQKLVIQMQRYCLRSCILTLFFYLNLNLFCEVEKIQQKVVGKVHCFSI